MNNNNDDASLPTIEPFMPGEDSVPSKQPEQNINYDDASTRMYEILAEARIKEAVKQRRESENRNRDTITYLVVLFVLLFLSISFLPKFLVIPIILSLSVIKVRFSMIKQNLNLKEALKDNIVLILLTGLFVFLAVLFIFDE